MTNFDKWQHYTSGLSSPQNFIDWGFRYLICASLQRRVWMPSGEYNLYPNIYVPLVAEPGIGKGLVVRAVNSILTHHKLKEAHKVEGLSAEEAATMQAVVSADKELSRESINVGTNAEDPLLIPTASDAVTYEALIQAMARSYRRINYSEFSDKHGREIMKIYGHSSLAFCLEEMASLFRKNTESMVNFLIQAYDCGDKYEYRTKTAGIDRVLRLCMNFLAGTTPDFMNEVFDDGLLSQGFSSRAFFIYASKNRKYQARIPKLTPEQEKCREDLRAHVKELTKLYGAVHVDESTWEWFEKWYADQAVNPSKRASTSSKLKHYYSRKNIHVMKTAMAVHFGEKTDMHVTLDEFKQAIDILHEEEKTMHLALSFTGSNPLAKLSQKVLGLLGVAPRQYSEILIETFSFGTQKELDEVLEYLCKTEQVESKVIKDPDTQLETVIWRLKE